MILSLPFPEKPNEDERNVFAVKIPTDPTNPDSDTVKYYMRRYSKGTIQDVLLFCRDLEELFELKHLDDDDAVARFHYTALFLSDTAKANWKTSKQFMIATLEEDDDIETMDNYRTTMDQWLMHQGLRPNTGAKIRDEVISYDKKKPMSMEVSELASWIETASELLTFCPGDTPELTNEEKKTLFKKMLPSTWTKHLKYREDHHSMTFQQLVTFMTEEEDDETPRDKRVTSTVSNRSVAVARAPNRRRYNYNSSGNRNAYNPNRGRGQPRYRSNNNGRSNNSSRGFNRNNNNNNQQPRRSNRQRGMYCPHHRQFHCWYCSFTTTSTGSLHESSCC